MVRSRAAVVAILAAASLGGWWLGALRHAALRESDAVVVRTLDGDTVEVHTADGHDETVRLLGVDTPETHHPTKPVQCFGPEAAAFTAERLTGRHVRLEFDVERHDKYGRTLAHVILGGVDFSETLVREGYARLLVIEPNHTHARALLAAELDARDHGRGLWGSCT